MKSIQTESIIYASIDKVWNTLMDQQNYGSWNPFIKKISGDPTVGSKLSVIIKSAESKTMNFTPIVLKNETEKEFRWLGHLYIKGLFDGEHYFKLEKLENDITRFIHGEKFSGLLTSVILKMIEKDTINGFEAMNKALKNKVEAEHKQV